MKLTKKLLQKIIKEEINSVLKESYLNESKAQKSFERLINGEMLNDRLSGFKGQGIVGKMWDEIILHSKLPKQEQVRWVKDLKSGMTNMPWPSEENGFVLHYFKQALKDIDNNILDPNNVISGKQMEQEQLPIWKAKQDAWELKKKEIKDKEASLSPKEKAARDAKDLEWSMYGGNPSERPWGLGS